MSDNTKMEQVMKLIREMASDNGERSVPSPKEASSPPRKKQKLATSKPSPIRTKTVTVSKSKDVLTSVLENSPEPCCSKSLPPNEPDISDDDADLICDSHLLSGDKDDLSDGSSDLDLLEQDALLEEETEKSNTSFSSSKANELKFPVLGSASAPAWTPPESSFKWFSEVADLELDENVLQSLKESFATSEELEKHFSPPRLPPSLWNLAKGNNAVKYRSKVVSKAQELSYLAIKPLLNVLNRLDDSDKESIREVASAIQLITNSNLLLNRFRRSNVAQFVQPKCRKSLLSQPVTHDGLFGKDFELASDNALKEAASSSKVLIVPKPFRSKFKGKGRSNSPYQDLSQTQKSGQFESEYTFEANHSNRGFRGRRSSRGRGKRRPNSAQ